MQPNQGHPQHPSAGAPQQRPMAQPPNGSLANPAQEEVLFEGVCRHSASLGGYLKWLFVSILGAGLGVGLMMIPALAGLPLYLLGLLGLPGMLWIYLQHVTTRYKISLRRVEFERGVLSKKVDSLEMWRVLDVRYSQSLIDRMLGNAKISLVSTDQTDPELVLHGLPDHRRLFERIREAVQAARHTSRPMEFVGGEHGHGIGEHLGPMGH